GQDCAKILVEQQNVYLKNESIVRENAMTWNLSKSEFILAAIPIKNTYSYSASFFVTFFAVKKVRRIIKKIIFKIYSLNMVKSLTKLLA
ncbi:MAG: hypothetical protein ABIR66_05520, partial [Saprospiraceae bacterium]